MNPWIDDSAHPIEVRGSVAFSSAFRFKERSPEQGLLVSWGDWWRMELLAERRDTRFPRETHGYWTPGRAKVRPTLVLAEEGAGFTSFRNWVRTRLHEHETLVEIDLESHDPADPKMLEGRVAAFLVDRTKIAATDDVVTALRYMQKVEDTSYFPGLLHIERVDRAAGGRLLGQLRGAYESTDDERTLQGLPLLLMGRDERAFDIEPYSAIQSVVDTCRLPRFNPLEVEYMLFRLRGSAANPTKPGRIAKLLHRRAGGQPLLTQLILSLLGSGNVPATAEAVEAAFRQLRDGPPAAVLGAWQTRLADMVLRDSELFELTRDLVQGREFLRDEAPPAARSLSIAGWLSPGLDESGNTEVWRLSDLHRFWALKVLRNPRRYASDLRRSG
jgi:hypothetical protein